MFRNTGYLFSILFLAAVPAKSENLSFESSSTYSGKKVVLTGEFISPATASRPPLVVLLHGCGGLDGAVKPSLRNHARKLNSAGFATLILDSFTPRGINDGWVCKRNSRLASAQAYRQRDVADSVRFLADQSKIDPENIFVMGQSNGGTTVVLIARHRKIPGLRAAVAYYPWCVIVGNGSNTPLLIFGAEEDEWTPPENCIANHNPGKGLYVVTYKNALHSFDLPIERQKYQGRWVGGNAIATKDSRSKMVEFFKRHLK